MSSERTEKNLNNGLRKKVVKVFPVAFKLINMYNPYGLYGWCVVFGNTAIFVVSIKEYSVEFSQASYRTDLLTKVKEFLKSLEV